VASLSCLGALGLGLVMNHDLVTQAFSQLGRASLLGLAGLLVLAAAHRLVHASLVKASVDGLSLRQAALASEAYTGCSNAMVMGSGLGAGLKTAMFRSWGVSLEGVAASLLATAVAPGLAMWLVLVGNMGPDAVQGRGGHTATLVTAGGALAFALQGGFWWMVLRRPGPTRRGALLVERRLRWLQRTRLPVPGRLRRLGDVAVAERIEHMRVEASNLGARRWAQMVGSAIVAQVLLALALAVSLSAVSGHASGVSTIDVLQAFAIARALASFVPLPGGLLVLDAGLVALLTDAGAERPSALAAIVVYRLVTFLLPMVTGFLAALLWRRSIARRGPAAVCDDDGDGDALLAAA
jgi:hypothetical protein